jgi:hypothetical protein
LPPLDLYTVKFIPRVGLCVVTRFQDIKLARSDGIVFLLRPLSVHHRWRGGLVRAPARGEKTMRIHIHPSVQRHSDLLSILSVVAIMFMVASGIYYLGESVHAPMKARIFAGPASTI